MKKMDLAGSQLTTNQDETTGIKLLNGYSEKVTPQVIDAEDYYARFSRDKTQTTAGFFVDCDEMQFMRDNTVRYGMIGKSLNKIIEV